MKKKVLILSAGDPAGINFCKSLQLQDEIFEICAADTDVYRLHLATSDSKHLLPLSNDPIYLESLNRLIDKIKPDLICAADTNPELEFLSENRDRINAHVFMPTIEAVRFYEDKYKTYLACHKSGIEVPETILLNKTYIGLSKNLVRFGCERLMEVVALGHCQPGILFWHVVG